MTLVVKQLRNCIELYQRGWLFIVAFRLRLIFHTFIESKFLKVTSCERKTGLLLIDIFERLFNPHKNGHLETGGLSFYLRVFKNSV